MKEPKRIEIANIPTPVRQSEFKGTKFLIKRDDLTGVELSGNKIRKLEYLLADAKRKNVDIIFTCGGEQSNHCRATAIAAASVGLKTKLFLWGKDRKYASGNLFFDKLAGAEFKFVNKKEYFNINAIMETEKQKLERKGKKVYIIPEGGSSTIGIWGYINFIRELKSQTGLKKVNSLVVACGSGGTASGILIGSALFNFPIKLFVVNVLYDKNTIEDKIINVSEEAIKKFNLKIDCDYSNLEILDGYSKEGYKNISDDKVKVITEYFSQSGILFDPAYTGKAFYAFQENFLGERKSTKTMFVHTGGLLGVFSKKEKYLKSVK